MYNILDVIGDLGGVLEILLMAMGFLIYPISKFSFIIAASKELFVARTKDVTMFEK